MSDEMKAREAAAEAVYDIGDLGPGLARQTSDAAIDAYLSGLSPLPDEQLDEIEKRANAATEGPWADEGSLIEGRDRVVAGAYTLSAAATDAAFIAHAREDIPTLLAEVRRFRALASEGQK